MGHSQVENAENRERILTEASRQVRRDGLKSVSVGTLMKSAGLTHGLFYRYFESRSAPRAVRRVLKTVRDHLMALDAGEESIPST